MRNSIFWQFGIAIPLALAGVTATTSGNHVLAQLTPDDSLGVESSTVTVEQFRDLIRGGAIRDSALFHSFDEFNVGDGRSVLFDLQNNTDILNIFTRVTGSSSSQILGTLGVLNDLGNANLFLLNPNGITFGANASLQLNGSFFATTADGFGFDNFTFSASGQEAPPPLLTVSIPRFASFRDNQGDIAVNQGNLTVNQGQSLSLLGGNVTVTGSGNVNPRPFNLNAPDGRIEIGSVGGSGSVSLTQTDAGFVLDYEGIETFGDITLNQFAYVDTNGENGGSLQLQGRDITLSDRTWIFVDTLGAGTGGGIVVNSEQLILEDGSRLTADVLGSGQGGNITVNASDSVQITGVSEDGQSGSTIAAQVFSDFTGNAGDLTINTSQLLIQDGAQVDVNTFGQGDAGDITIRANSVNLDSGALIQANTSGQGDAGAISITATESVSLSNDSDAARLTAIANAVLSTGNGADLTITTPNLSLSGNTGVLTSTAGDGNAGNLIINASESISLTNGSQLQAAAIALNEASIGGAPGNIVINAEGASVTIDNSIVGTTIINSASNTGGGDISINASSFSLTNGSNLTSSLRSGQGDAGDITIQSNSVNLDSGAQIEASTFGQGDSGAINITATESVSLSNDSDATRATTIANIISSTGNGADLTITTPNLSLSGNTSVLTSTAGDGNAGNLIINASESIALTNGSQLQAAAIALNEASIGGAPGNIFINAESASVTIDNSIVGTIMDDSTSNTGGGDISINASSLSLNNASNLTSSLRSGQGDAGDITINVTGTILIEGIGSGVFSTTAQGGVGNAGTINIDSEAIIIRDGGEISVDNQGTGLGGNIDVASDTLTLDDGRITANNSNDSDGGNITLNISDYILLLNGDGTPDLSDTLGGSLALISADSDGDGGNITINTTALVAIPGQDSDITANSTGENTQGGQVTIDAEVVLGIQASDNDLPGRNDITAISQSGSAGTVTINSPQTNPQQEDIEPPEDVTDETDVVSQNACSIGIGSQLANSGRGGLPQIPGFTIRNDTVDVDLVDEVLPAPPPEAIKPHHRTTVTFTDSEGEEFKPAMGAVLLPNGMVQFVDYNPTEVYRDMYASVGCSS